MVFRNSLPFSRSAYIGFFLGATLALSDSVCAQGLYTNVTGTHLPVTSVNGPGMDVEAADLDGDGDLDVVIANEYQGNTLLLNNGNGLFTNATAGRLAQNQLDSEDIAIADLDGDGDLDLVFATEDHTIHELHLNNGTGTFTYVPNALPGSTANSVLAADLNLDGHPDLIFGNANPQDTPGQNFSLINNGNATFSNQTATRLPALTDITQDIKLGDLNGDGFPDLVVGNEDGNRILINNGSGVFTDETAARLPQLPSIETRKVTLADVDGDSDLDIFFANVGFRPGMIKYNRLLINNGSGIFTDESATRLPYDNDHTLEGAFLDMDLDGDLDLVTVAAFGAPVKALLNNGAGIFADSTQAVLPAALTGDFLGIKVADFNADGLQDLYLVNRGARDQLLFRNDTSTVTGMAPALPNAKPTLQGIYPNPAKTKATIRYSLPAPERVELSLFDAQGRTVMQLLPATNKAAGHYQTQVGLPALASGVYFCRLSTRNWYSQSVVVIE